MNWVPQDSSHPLLVPENADFLREVLFDYMVEGEVNPDDPRMSEPEGLRVHNLNGKTLTFTKDASGKPRCPPVHTLPDDQYEKQGKSEIASFVVIFSE